MCEFIAQPPQQNPTGGVLSQSQEVLLAARVNAKLAKMNIMRALLSICGPCIVFFLCYAFPVI
jgi:hypothetical protein